jgi:hypothetical protein
VIFGGGNDNISAGTSGNNVIVAGLSTGKTGAPNAPRMSGGSGKNIYIAGFVDCTLVDPAKTPLASTGRLDYEALRIMDDFWATTSGGLAGAMSDDALFSIVNTPGAIMTGTARATIVPGSGQSWFIVKGANNPVNTPTGLNQDFVAAQYQPTTPSSSNYRQAIQYAGGRFRGNVREPDLLATSSGGQVRVFSGQEPEAQARFFPRLRFGLV